MLIIISGATSSGACSRGNSRSSSRGGPRRGGGSPLSLNLPGKSLLQNRGPSETTLLFPEGQVTFYGMGIHQKQYRCFERGIEENGALWDMHPFCSAVTVTKGMYREMWYEMSSLQNGVFFPVNWYANTFIHLPAAAIFQLSRWCRQTVKGSVKGN